MFSHACAGGDVGIVEQFQASPSDMPSILVRVVGQMSERPSMSTDHKVGRGTTGTEDAWVVGWDIR